VRTQQQQRSIHTSDYLICVTHTDSRWETDKWSIFVQVHHSHDVVSTNKWQMFVTYTSRGKAA